MKNVFDFSDFYKRIKKFHKKFSLKEKIIILFPQPILLLFLPRTYLRIYKNVIKLNNKSTEFVTGFSSHMAITLPYYLRFGENVEKYGKRGYVYEDALGFSLKERFWFNPTALRIFNKLKIQRYTILTATILLTSIVFIGILEGVSLVKLAVLIILIGGSSLFLIPFFRLIKPEILSWAFFPLAFYTFLEGYYLSSAVICLIISVLNFTTTLLIVETIALYSLFSANLVSGVLVLIVPATKLLFDSIPFFKKSIAIDSKNSFLSGLLEVLGGYSAKSRTDNFLKLGIQNIYLCFIYFVFVISFIVQGLSLGYLIILINPLILFILNQKFCRVADTDTFYRLFFVISSVFVILHPTFLSIIAYIMLIYISPATMIEMFENTYKYYPHLRAYSIKNSEKFLKSFFSRIPDKSRIVFEAKDTETNIAGFFTVFSYFEYILSKRSIEFLPMEWLRMTQFDYFMKEYVKINSKSSKEMIEEKCRELGVDYIIVCSKDFANNLTVWGYEKIGELKWGELKERLFNLDKDIPKKNLCLFKIPFATGLISPITSLKRKPNYMEFDGKAGVEYIIKYNYHPSWNACQNGKEVKIYKAKGRLSYLSLQLKKNGKVKFRFNNDLLN